MKFAFRHLRLCAAIFVAAVACADSRVCVGCHAKEAEAYRKTGMGRSFYRLTPRAIIEDFLRKNTYFHAPSESYFTMVERDGKYYQRRHQVDPGGKPVNVVEMSVDYVMGSGNHARAYLHRTDSGRLIELPLGWYAEKGGYWAMNPGYDRPDHDGFRRPITYDCMFCHNGYPATPKGNAKPFAEAIYRGHLPEGIDCERCHGEGAKHVQLASAKADLSEIRRAIVNPAKLPPARQMDLCMSCHLETTSFPLPNAVQKYDRGPFSFRAGERLEDFLLNFDHAPGTGREDKFEIVNAGYRLRRSQCFLQSKGSMTCGTCHSPHRAETIAGHNQTCRSCHAKSEHVKAGGNCIDCHMPKRRTEDVVHVVVTDHLIQRKKPPGDLLAERAERSDSYRGPVVPYYPAKLPAGSESDLYLAVAQVKQSSNLKPGIAQLTTAIAKYTPQRGEWYLELAEALEKDRQTERALSYYRQASKRMPDSAYAAQRLGTALRKTGRQEEAIEVLKRATMLEPARAMSWHELGMSYQSAGKTDEAIAALSKAIATDPGMPEAHNNLGILRTSEADFREAIRLKPSYADARYNFALLLGKAGRYDEAKRELEASVRADPKFVDAREMLGDLLMATHQEREAEVQYREALWLLPDSARSHYGLGVALAAAGKRTEAAEHLRKAAQDPQFRERAASALRQLGL